MSWKKDDTRNLLLALLAALVVFVMVGLLDLLSPLLSGVAAVVVASLIVGVILKSQPEPKLPIVKESAKRPIIVVLQKPQPEPKPPIVEGSAERPTKESPTWAYDGVIEVQERRERIRADLRRGNVIEGTLEEIHNLPFDFFIFDQKNYAKFSNDRDEGVAALELIGEHTYHVKWLVKHDGAWYFVFDLYSKQNDRTIRVTLDEHLKSQK